MNAAASRRDDQEAVTVRDAAAAHFLLDPVARTVLTPFFRDTTVALAARELGRKPNTLLRQVKRLSALGLLTVTGEQRRPGRAIKHYRVSHQRFFVPFWASDAVTLEDLLMQAVQEPNRLISRSIAQLYSVQAPQLGYLITRLDSGRIAHDLSIDGQTPLTLPGLERPWFRDGRTLRLTPERAAQFMQELSELLERYDDQTGDRHLAFLAVAPLLGRP